MHTVWVGSHSKKNPCFTSCRNIDLCESCTKNSPKIPTNMLFESLIWKLSWRPTPANLFRGPTCIVPIMFLILELLLSVDSCTEQRHSKELLLTRPLSRNWPGTYQNWNEMFISWIPGKIGSKQNGVRVKLIPNSILIRTLKFWMSTKNDSINKPHRFMKDTPLRPYSE